MSRRRPIARFDAGSFSELRLLALSSSKAYGEGRLEHAFSGLGSLHHQLGIYYSGHGFYYPRLIRGVLLIQLSAVRNGYLDEAMALFEDLSGDPSIAHLIDENLYAAMATVHLKRGEVAEAAALYRKAHEIVVARGKIDPDVLHNIVVTTLAAEADGGCYDVEPLLDEGLPTKLSVIS